MDRPPIRPVLEHYDLTYQDSSGWGKMRCPNPDHDDRHASASVNPDEGVFHCFACGIKGDSLTLIQTMEGCDFATAVTRAEEITGGSDQGVRTTPLTGRRLPGGKGFRPRFRRDAPARLRPFTRPGA